MRHSFVVVLTPGSIISCLDMTRKLHQLPTATGDCSHMKVFTSHPVFPTQPKKATWRST